MYNKALVLSFMLVSFLFTAIQPAFATTPNLESYDMNVPEPTDDEHFLQENVSYEELPALSVPSAAKSIVPEHNKMQLLPNLQLAKQWKPLEAIADSKKPWRVTFNQPVNVTEENTYKAKIIDESGEEFNYTIRLNSEGLLLTPNEPYQAGTVYTLILQKDLDSHKGVQLGRDVYQQFVYQPPQPEAKPEITEVTDLYSALFIGLTNMDDKIYVDKYTKDSNAVFAELRKVLDEHPEIFYYQYEGSLFYSSGYLAAKYAYPKDTITRMKKSLKQGIDTLYATAIKPGMTEYEKVKAVHDYVVLQTAYDYDNYLKNTIPRESYTMYGVLVNKTAVCNGYGLAMVYLLNELGIDTIYVKSTPAMNHGWNKVKIDGRWYSLDVTWDDPVPDRKGKVSYGYFLVSDSQLAKTHSWNNAGLPKATDTRYEYMSGMWTSDTENGWIYYANSGDDVKIYKMKTDGSANQKVANVRANELVVHEGWIYFSNYSHSGYLFKMKTDGSSLTQITDFLTSEISKEGGVLYFTDSNANKNYQMDLK
ncbi:DUF5050 domain-containing protein [Sporosarcina sp. P33]|uniref:DUF5050 domain-containing protein n=1 Tax=Sporosarcina sp. P33 TaxID=1930764 RepID=UPI0009C03499|nr:DUF5050 domain-containing protein [Sporosarcina sp. P33]ARD48883.1 hypothetical protein SporoP33_12035 [Sporosarcina sp. P33]